MSKTVSLVLNGKDVEAPVTFEALQEVTRVVGCPISLLGSAQGKDTPISQLQAINAVAIAKRLAGDRRPHAKIASEVYGWPIQTYYGEACRYLMSFFADASQISVEVLDDAPAE
jgi:hypothetical protein